MQSFIQMVYDFVNSIYMAIGASINAYDYNTTFVNKQIISGDLINIGLTWKELFLYVTTWIIVILFIIFIFKLVSGVIRFFFIGK